MPRKGFRSRRLFLGAIYKEDSRMKKILIGVLLLAAAGGVFAQDEGLKLSGDVKTGLRFETGQYLGEPTSEYRPFTDRKGRYSDV
jgi:hypothetical protein